MTTLNWNFVGDDSKPVGYSYMARCMREGLRNIGVDLDTLAKTLVLHTVPWHGFSAYPDQKLVISSMWEFTKVPPGMVSALELFDLAIAPCSWSADLFAPYVKSTVVPLGIHTGHYQPRLRERPYRLTILCAATNQRKGPKQVLEGIRRSGVPADAIFKGQKAWDVCEPTEGVELISHPVGNMNELYSRADLYVSGARGEGWDLIAWEALGTGMPTIVPSHTAYLDWMHLCQDTLTGFKAVSSEVLYFGPTGDWFVQDPDEIAAAISKAWENYEDYAQRAYESAQEMARSWTWEDAARKFVSAISGHGLPLEPYPDPSGLTDRQPLVPCRFLRSIHGADVGGFNPGPVGKGAVLKLPPGVAVVLEKSGAVEQIRS